ncbi:Molybdopterin synthase catalytic subunit [Sergentomyia squamirostris]
MDYLKLTSDKLITSDVSDLVAHEGCGAISMFVGTTRDYFEDKKVISLEYEAYEPMALKTMKKICEEIRSKWSQIKHIAIYHRLGLVAVKEASVVIAVSSPHRKDSLEAVAFAIEELKKQVPIWKKEQYTEAQGTWKENKESGTMNRQVSGKINFQLCPVVGHDVPKHLVQITTNHAEIERRIEMFVERKREEINTSNIEDFIEQDIEESCARVQSAVYRIKDSKGHLKVRHVKNEYGPQTLRENYTNVLNKLQEQSPEYSLNRKKVKFDHDFRNFGISERLKSMEGHLKIPSSSEDIFQRIKTLEDRILYLESVSPEYIHFLHENEKKQKEDRRGKKRRHSINQLEEDSQ